jgi:hypothetical protein
MIRSIITECIRMIFSPTNKKSLMKATGRAGCTAPAGWTPGHVRQTFGVRLDQEGENAWVGHADV